MGEAVPAEDDAAPLDLARLLRGVEEEGREFVLTRGGRPVARPAPERAAARRAAARRARTPEQERALAEFLEGTRRGWPGDVGRVSRDDIHQERLSRFDRP